jgi:hypothetical protein
VIFVFMALSMSMTSARVGSDMVGAVEVVGVGGGEEGGLGFGGAAVDNDEDRLDRDTRLSRA